MVQFYQAGFPPRTTIEGRAAAPGPGEVIRASNPVGPFPAGSRHRSNSMIKYNSNVFWKDNDRQ